MATSACTSLALHLILCVSFFGHSSRRVLAKEPQPHLPNPNCSRTCGGIEIPFPFYLNATSCRTFSDAFRLSCVNSSSLFLSIASKSYRVLHFFPDGVLVDFPNASMCRQYSDLKSFSFSASEFFGISTANVLGLSDCEDSSLCKSGCGKIPAVPGCEGQLVTGSHPSCCYPLSDSSAWRPGDSLLNFSLFGCRGFFSWLVFPGSGVAKRGVKLEWAIPKNTTLTACAANADAINSTVVASGVRCRCRDGFVGDGFALGSGCLKSCLKDGKEVRGNECYRDNHGTKKGMIYAGAITSALAVASLAGVCLFKWLIGSSDKFISDPSRCQSAILSAKTCRTRLFTYHELEEATSGFDDEQKIVDSTMTSLYIGVLMGGSHVAVHRIRCANERDLVRVLFRLEALSSISHRNLARIVGWSVDSSYTSTNTPFVVYDRPENGTLHGHLHGTGDQTTRLDWYKRLNIAAETASILAFLRHEISPPIFHHDLQSGYIFLDADFSVKLAGFQLHNSGPEEGSHLSDKHEGSHFRENDVYSLGLVLLEIITGDRTGNFATTALQKIKNAKIEEIVDPSLYYHEQLQFLREQIEKVADLATRCLLFGADGRLGMADVARELMHISKENIQGSSQNALEETFSNSSLLQMISMSPDSIYVP